MALPKILAPLLPQSRRLQQKQHDPVLSHVLPMRPPSNNPYNNMIGLATEEILVESVESVESVKSVKSVENPATETAIILHEKPTSFDMCANAFLIESCHDNEQPDHKEKDPNLANKITETYQSFDLSTSSLTDSGNETLAEITPEQDVEERIMSATSPMDYTTFASPPRLMKEESSFEDTKNQQQDLKESPSKLAIFDHSIEIQVISDAKEISHPIKKPQDKVTIEEEKDEEQGQNYFTLPLRAVHTTHQGDLFDEPEEPDFKLKSNFKKTLDREGSLKSKCIKWIHGMKYRLSQEKKQIKKENNIKTAFSVASANKAEHIDTKLARSVSAVTIINEERSTPIYRRNMANSVTKAEPLAPYMSPKLGSHAYDIKVLCNQCFFGRY